MTTTAAPIGLTYNSTDIQDLDGIFLEITQGLDDSPEVRGIDVLVPGLDGQVARPRRWHQRRIVLTGYVRGVGIDQDAGRAAYRSWAFAMRDLFDPAAAPATLAVTLEDGSSGTIECRTLNTIWDTVVASEFSKVSVELLAVEQWSFEVVGS